MTTQINFNQIKGAEVNIFDFMSSAQIAEVQSTTYAQRTTEFVADAAFNSAVAAVAARLQVPPNAITAKDHGGKIVVPAGRYRLSTTIETQYGITFIGEGPNVTQITFDGSGDCFYLGYHSVTDGRQPGCSMQDLSIELIATTSTGIHLFSPTNASISNVGIGGPTAAATNTNVGIRIDGGNPTIGSAFLNLFSNLNLNTLHTGILVDSSNGQGATQNIFLDVACSGGFTSPSTGDTGSIGIHFYSGYDSLILGGNLEHCKYGIFVDDSVGGANSPAITSYGTRWEACGYDIWLDPQIIRCKFIGSTTLDYSRINGILNSPTNIFDTGDGQRQVGNVLSNVSPTDVYTITDNGSVFTMNGNVVTMFFDITFPSTAGKVQTCEVGYLPFKGVNNYTGVGFCNVISGASAATTYGVQVVPDSSTLNFYKDNVIATAAAMTGCRIAGSVTYVAAD